MCKLNNKVFSLPILFVLIMMYCGLESFCQITKKKEMNTIEFIPKEFHDVKLGLYECGENICTPRYPNFELKLFNQLFINIPQKVICNACDSVIVPMCGAYVITSRRGLKYNHLSTPVIHVRKIEEEIWYSGEIVDTNLQFEYPSLPPNYHKEEEKRQQRIKEAQKYSDDELNEDPDAGGSAINVNIADYIKIPFEQGIYEVYVSMSGLESNRMRVEIIKK